MLYCNALPYILEIAKINMIKFIESMSTKLTTMSYYYTWSLAVINGTKKCIDLH